MLKLNHKKFQVWELSLALTESIYQLVRHFPDDEKYGLTAQIKRASISVTSNISEGAARISKAEKRRFFEIARSSLVEVDAQLEIALKLGFINTSNQLLPQISKQMLSTFKLLSAMMKNP
jgi:four helix bundle protein